MKTRIAVDTGGTFTDLVLLDGDGLRVHKVRSTPEDPARAILEGISELTGEQDFDEVIHGSTVATNTLLESKGARVAFLTTAGFEGILAIGRQTRKHLYSLAGEQRQSLIPDGLTFGVQERLDASGREIKKLSREEMERVEKLLREHSPEAVAICFLHSYVNPGHEEELAKQLEAAGFVMSVSSRILPEHREFERASTTVANAYVTPIMARYLTALEQGLAGKQLRVTQSAGGFVSAEAARREAVQTILSGPAGGAVGALALAAASGFERVIAFDMGGTSTDVSLLDGGLPMTTETVVGDFPVCLPMLDIETVGAGGGSIAYIDGGGSLRAGPRSAGAQPGPACYGVGEEMTVTDANLLLGRLDARNFLGGRMQLDLRQAEGVADELAKRLGLSRTELAEGVIRVANSNMERALRVVSVQRGNDPRDFALLAFGGAGPMHACDLARALEISTVLVPQHAGILSAVGMLLADYTKYRVRSVLQNSDRVSIDELDRWFDELVAKARKELTGEGFEGERLRTERSLDLRYIGQSFEIPVTYGPDYRKRFNEAHRKRYGYCDDTRAVEIVSIRVKAVGEVQKPSFQPAEFMCESAVPAEFRESVFNGQSQRTAFFARDSLRPGMTGQGPAIIGGGESTTVVTPGWRFAVDAMRTLRLAYNQGPGEHTN